MLTLIEQLRHLARVRPDVDEFSLVSGTHTIRVSYSSGSTESLSLSTPYPVHWPGAPAPPATVSAARPMSIQLSFEGTLHVASKQLGINREAQLGDPEFDRLIYVDSQTSDAVIRTALASPEARRMVVELCRLGGNVNLDDGDGDICVHIVSLPRLDHDQDRAARICDALYRLSLAVTPIRATNVRAKKDWVPTAIAATFVLSMIFLAVPILLSIFLAEGHCSGITSCGAHPDCCAPLGVGTGASFLLTLPLSVFYFVTLRGRSSSSFQILGASFVTFFFLALIFISIARIAI
jgi:hypothetical protein